MLQLYHPLTCTALILLLLLSLAPPPSLSTLSRQITNYHKSTKVATVVYENTSDVWEGSMKLDLKMLNGGPSSGELLGRGKSRMHCRPYAIYKPRAARVGTSLGEAIAAQQEA